MMHTFGQVPCLKPPECFGADLAAVICGSKQTNGTKQTCDSTLCGQPGLLHRNSKIVICNVSEL